jgi:integrase
MSAIMSASTEGCEMSVHKRKWKTAKGEVKEAWVADYSLNGKRHIKTFALKREADAYAKQTGVEIKRGRHVPDSVSITVAQAADKWIGAVKAGRNDHPPAERSTLRQYRSHLQNHILPVLGTKKLNQLTRTVVADFKDHLLVKLSRPMARKVMASLRGILGEAEDRGLVVGNSAAHMSIGGAGRHRQPPVIPSKADVKAIMAELDRRAVDRTWRRWRVFFAMAIFTGMRASEIRGLPWDAVDLKGGTITVKQRADEYGTISSPKSLASRRTIRIPAFLVTLLRDWKIECPPGPLALPNACGNVQRLCSIHARAWYPLQISAGIVKADGSPRLTFHSLRHFRASMLIDDGANAKEVQVEMGHSAIAMTYDRYGHLFHDEDADTRRAERAERLASKLRG